LQARILVPLLTISVILIYLGAYASFEWTRITGQTSESSDQSETSFLDRGFGRNGTEVNSFEIAIFCFHLAATTSYVLLTTYGELLVIVSAFCLNECLNGFIETVRRRDVPGEQVLNMSNGFPKKHMNRE
jgi:hypothetical protein